jgi:hypothetical protein
MLKWRRRRKQARCFHHEIGGNPANTVPAVSWIAQELIDLGRGKLFRCTGCGKAWII